MFLTATAVGVAAVSILLALTVWLRNPHSSYNVSFAVFATLLGLWIPTNFFGSYQHTNVHSSFLFFADFTLAPLLVFSFGIFGLEAVRFYRRKAIKVNRFILFMTGGLAITLSLSAAFHLVSLPIYTPSNVLNTKEVLYYPYNLFVGTLVLAALLTLIYSTIGAKKEYKPQTRLVFWGLLLASTVIITANILFPEIRLAQTLSYFAILIMLFSLSYSIVRHRLFDIRPIIARSVAYVLLLASFASIFTLSLLTLTTVFYKDQHVSLSLRIAYVILALLLALIFQPLRKIFDRLTNQVFYRDAYDSQSLLNELNKVLTQQIALDVITRDCLKIICENLKVSRGHFVVLEKKGVYKMASWGTASEVETYISSDITEITKNIVVADELESGVNKEILAKYGLSLSLKLVTRKGTVGYILLKAKSSGSIYTTQDIRILTIIANELAIAVENALAFEEIQKFNITLQQRIDEATKELKRVNNRLREVDKTKDEFVSMASHQLRTPLTAVKGYLSMILEGDTGTVKKDQAEMTQKAFNSAQKMVYLIADMLNVSRLQTGKFVIENQPTNLAEVVESEVSQLQSSAEERHLKLLYHKPKKFPLLNLDETKIRQVVMNFIDNAIYYTPAEGSVTVELSSSDEEVRFTVSDTGIGVPANLQHHLFSKFYRADNARKMRSDGTGLGLFMAKKVVVAQGGAIIFKSTEGKGSTFGFSFPRKTLEAKS